MEAVGRIALSGLYFLGVTACVAAATGTSRISKNDGHPVTLYGAKDNLIAEYRY